MSRYSAGILTLAGSTTFPIASLYAVASRGGTLREVGVFNTTAVAVALFLRRLTSQGTQGSAKADGEHDENRDAADMTFHETHTGAPGLGQDLGYRTVLPGTIGAGIIWTFGDTGIVIPAGTANGVGLLVENGTGQACQAYMVWDE